MTVLPLVLALSAAPASGAPAPDAPASDDPGVSLAVLPLDQAAGSETYDGLGLALAGMLTTDLSSVPRLALVERSRLDAVLGELKLDEGGFVDPKTARKLGKGVGANLVLVGSYSVVGEQFLMDARLVEVGSGRVLDAADAHGTVKEFVAVEKDVVEALLGKLDVSLDAAARRHLLIAAPTEDFGAFAKYGEGLAREEHGDVDGARADFEAALAADPHFAEAQSALLDLSALVEQAHAADAARATGAQAAAQAKILADFPADADRPKDFAYDMTSTVGLVLRWSVLEDQGRDCERYKDMTHWLDRVGWKVDEPKDDHGVYGYYVGKIAELYGYERLPSDVAGPPSAHESLVDRDSRLLYDTATFVLDPREQRLDRPGDGLLGSLRRCLPPAQALDEIDRVREKVKKAGLSGQFPEHTPSWDFDLDESLVLRWMWLQATTAGASNELEARTKALLAAHPEGDEHRRDVLSEIDDVTREAKSWEEHQARRLGIPPDALVATIRGIAAADPKVVRADGPYCSWFLKTDQPRADDWVHSFDDMDPDDRFRDTAIDQGARFYAMFGDMGCLVGVPGRFATVDDVVAFASALPKREKPGDREEDGCRNGWESLSGLTQPGMLDQIRAYPDTSAPPEAYSLLLVYHAELQFWRCVAP